MLYVLTYIKFRKVLLVNVEFLILLAVIAAFGIFAFSKRYGQMGGVQTIDDNPDPSDNASTDHDERAE